MDTESFLFWWVILGLSHDELSSAAIISEVFFNSSKMEICSPYLHVYAANLKMLKCKWTTIQVTMVHGFVFLFGYILKF